MKLTKSKLKQTIAEEISLLLVEAPPSAHRARMNSLQLRKIDMLAGEFIKMTGDRYTHSDVIAIINIMISAIIKLRRINYRDPPSLPKNYKIPFPSSVDSRGLYFCTPKGVRDAAGRRKNIHRRSARHINEQDRKPEGSGKDPQQTLAWKGYPSPSAAKGYPQFKNDKKKYHKIPLSKKLFKLLFPANKFRAPENLKIREDSLYWMAKYWKEAYDSSREGKGGQYGHRGDFWRIYPSLHALVLIKAIEFTTGKNPVTGEAATSRSLSFDPGDKALIWNYSKSVFDDVFSVNPEREGRRARLATQQSIATTEERSMCDELKSIERAKFLLPAYLSVFKGLDWNLRKRGLLGEKYFARDLYNKRANWDLLRLWRALLREIFNAKGKFKDGAQWVENARNGFYMVPAELYGAYTQDQIKDTQAVQVHQPDKGNVDQVWYAEMLIASALLVGKAFLVTLLLSVEGDSTAATPKERNQNCYSACVDKVAKSKVKNTARAMGSCVDWCQTPDAYQPESVLRKRPPWGRKYEIR